MPRNVRPFPSEILYLAKRYLWWQSLEDTLEHPLRLVAAVMDEGTSEECALVRRYFGAAMMRRALQQAAHGWFRAGSWDYWHHDLGLIPADAQPPAQPVRLGAGSRGGRHRPQADAESNALSAGGIAP
jgi:hypothetical protein